MNTKTPNLIQNKYQLIRQKALLTISNLKKYYHKDMVLDIPSLKFYEGKTYLIIGENGSGKSTLIKSIIGIINYEGKVEKEVDRIGYLPERFPEISLIKAKSFLNNLLCDHEKANTSEIIKELSDFLELDLEKNISQLSKGNLQKLMIIQALMNCANLIVLDEPLNGLDIDNQNKFLFLIKQLRSDNRCVIITTHYPKYYDGIYDEILFMNKGHINEAKTNF